MAVSLFHTLPYNPEPPCPANTSTCKVVAHGMGRHASTLSLDELSIVLKHLLAFECLYVTAVAAVKLSILAMYLRIFPSREFRIGAWVIGSTIIAWWIAIVLVCIFQCNPIYIAWVPWDKGTCINLRASFIGNGRSSSHFWLLEVRFYSTESR